MWANVKKYLNYSQTIVLCASIAFILWLKYAPTVSPVTSTPGQVTSAPLPKPVEKIIEKIKVVRQPVERVVYLEKAPLAASLKMPELKLEPGEPVAVASIPSHTGPTTAIAMMDNVTGETRMVTRQEPTPFFEIKKEFRLQGRYLFAGANVAELDLNVLPVRLGPVNILAGVGAEMDRDSSTLRGRAFVGFEYKF